MNCIRGITISLCLILFARVVVADGAENGGNLLKNPHFIPNADNPDAIDNWRLIPADGWKRGVIEAFQGQPFALHFLQRSDSGTLAQDSIAVEPNTWYRITAWYHGDLRPANTSNLWLHLAHESEKEYSSSLCMDRLHGLHLGASNKWREVRLFVNSGKHKKLRFQARVYGKGTAMIGNCTMRKVNEFDLCGPYVHDGDFEDGIVGCEPFDFFCGTRQPVIALDGKYPSGKKSMKLVVNPGEDLRISGPATTPVTPGSEVIVTFSARSDRKYRIQAGLFGNGKGLPRVRGVELDNEWQRVVLRYRAPDSGESNLKGFQTLFFMFSSLEKTEVERTVWIDDVSIRVVHEDDTKDPRGSKGTQPLFGTEKNRVRNSSFEAGMLGWDYRWSQNIMDGSPAYVPADVRIDNTTSARGDHSLRVVVPKVMRDGIPNEGLGVFSTFFPVVKNEKYTLSFWAKASEEASMLIYLFSPGFGGPGGHNKLTKEWKRYQVPVVPTHANEDMIQFRMSFRNPGTYWIDGVQVEKGSVATAYDPAGLVEVGADMIGIYPWYKSDEKPRANVYLCWRGKEDKKLELKCAMKDWRGKVVYESTEMISVPAGRTISMKRPMRADRFGALVAHFTLKEPSSGETSNSEVIYGVFPEVRDVDPEKSWFGVHNHTTIRENLILRAGTLDDYYKLLRLIGCRWDRSNNIGSWGIHEKEKGQWRWMDGYVNAARGNGVKMMPIMGSALDRGNGTPMPKWAASDRVTGRGNHYPKMEYWRNFIKKMIEHYGDRIDAYEILNETGLTESDGYVDLTKAAFEVARATDPRARIIAPAYPCQQIPYGPDDDTWVGQVMKKGLYNYIDVYSGHFYPPGSYGSNPYTFEGAVGQYGNAEEDLLVKMKYLRKAYGDKPVWDTESAQTGASQVRSYMSPAGYNYTRTVNARMQADRFIRWSVIRMAGGIARSFYHTVAYPGNNGYMSYQLAENNFSPRPVVVAYAQAARRLDGFAFIKKATVGDSTWAYLFKVDDKLVVVYWDYLTDEGGKILLALASNAVTAETLMGNPIVPKQDKNGIILPLDRSPVYVIFDKLDAKSIISAFEKAEVSNIATSRLTGSQ